MKWDIDQDHPAFPVLHRDSEKSHGVARKYGEQLPKKLDWRWREWGQKWELWLDVGKNTISDAEEKGEWTNVSNQGEFILLILKREIHK